MVSKIASTMVSTIVSTMVWTRSFRFSSVMILVLIVAGCQKPDEITEDIARRIILPRLTRPEVIYAEVPQRIFWGPTSPKDDYDEKAVRTIRNLEKAGLVTIEESHTDDSSTFIARTSKKGFSILGITPSARGPALRGHIAMKHYDGLKNFLRHPNDPTVASIEIVWHYESPTNLYELFETRINKPLNKEFATVTSIYWKDGGWRFGTIVGKTEPTAGK